MNRLLTALAILFLSLSVACASPTDKKKSAENNPAKTNRITPVVLAVKKVENAVVNIRTEKIVQRKNPFGNPSDGNFFNDFFGFNRTYKTQSLGSGVIIKPDGTIITNYHVISGASKVYVMTDNNKTYEAKYIGGDEILDIAVLKIIHPDRKFPVLQTGNSDDIMLGETVIAMGNPYGLNNSITTGIVSSLNRVINVGNGYSAFIQTDALINPGNSGGPLINLDAQMIGINTAIFKDAQGIGFSIPINMVLRVLPEIMKYGKVRMGYMGFTVTQQKADDRVKLVVTRVEKKSNANYIGIEKGDQIVQIAGVPVASLQAMSNMLRSYPPGSNVHIVIKRGDKTLRGKISISDYPENYGLKVLKNNYGITFTQKGKFVAIDKSTQSDYFQKGDILIAVNNKEVKNIKELNGLIADNLGKVAVLSLYRGRTVIRVKIPL